MKGIRGRLDDWDSLLYDLAAQAPQVFEVELHPQQLVLQHKLFAICTEELAHD